MNKYIDNGVFLLKRRSWTMEDSLWILNRMLMLNYLWLTEIKKERRWIKKDFPIRKSKKYNFTSLKTQIPPGSIYV